MRSEPNDPFNIGLGFNLGILDNDRSNNGVVLIGKVLKDAVTSSISDENHLAVTSQSDQRYISFDSLFGEIRDYHHIASGDLYVRKLYSSEDFFSSRASVSSINGDSEVNHKSRSSQATTSHSRRKRKVNRSHNKDELDVDTDPQTITEEDSQQIRADSSKDSAAAFYEDTVRSVFMCTLFHHSSKTNSFLSTVELHGWSIRAFPLGCSNTKFRGRLDSNDVSAIHYPHSSDGVRRATGGF